MTSNSHPDAPSMEQPAAGSPDLKITWLRLILGLTLLLNAAGFYQFILPAIGIVRFLDSTRWMAAIVGWAVIAILTLILLISTWTSLVKNGAFARGLSFLVESLARLGRYIPLIYITAAILFAILIFGSPSPYLGGIFARLFLFWLLMLFGATLYQAHCQYKNHRLTGWGQALLVSSLVTSLAYRLASFIPDISTYPFTLSWSEASRYYYASLFFAERIYGLPLPPTVLHPSRYLMQAAPFIISNSPLWLHRAWQVILWLVMPALTAFLLVRRLPLKERTLRWLLAIWIFLFLLIGPVYYHLLVPVAIILWGFQTDEGRASLSGRISSLLAVVLASAWAGISRVNWFPVPGLLAAALYFLTTPISIKQPQSRADTSTDLPSAASYRPSAIGSIIIYLLEPAFWTLLGTGIAFAAQALYIIGSGNTAGQFTTSFSSDLLWNRLLPSRTYPVGILPGILLVSLPIILLVQSRLSEADSPSCWRRYHPIRLLGLAAILLVLFAGGLVVSVKIGGGSNLHNLDAYLALLLVTAVFLYFQAAAPDSLLPATYDLPPKSTSKAQKWGILLTLLITAFFTVTARGPSEPLPDQKKIERGLAELTQRAEEASQLGEVLFISNRQLITFDYIDVPLVPEYERVFLMEMAMAGDAEYLGRFYDDLKNRRFSLIVIEPSSQTTKGETAVFGEENDAWVKQVLKILLCYYRPEKADRDLNLQLLVPRQGQPECLE
ncbi:MAG: hypothetical protein JXB15_00240 [Anaerolineales bacterium]|nr:hypothetical protein [Anaerolineales bacterium]